MKRKKHRGGRALIWLILFVLVGGICYLSFQNGEVSKQMGNRLYEFLKARMGGYLHTDMDEKALTYIMRQFGRGLLFFTLGIVTTAAVNLSFPRINWFFKSVFIIIFLGVIACFTERMKVFIASRHYAPVEMAISFIAAMSGFVLMAILLAFFRMLLGSPKRKKYNY